MLSENRILIALLHEVSPGMQDCELTHLARQPIDLELAQRQHQSYAATLRALGCEIIMLPASGNLPDSVFVEDIGFVLDELAVLTRPGAASRREETEAIRKALTPYRQLAEITTPATLDGGDLLCLGHDIYVGQSTRTNAYGLAQLKSILEPFGYRVRGVPVDHCLHLKSAVTQIRPGMLLLNPHWVDPGTFIGYETLFVDPAEPYAANAICLEANLVYPESFPRTQDMLERLGLRITCIDVSELQKAEGAVTCCSLIFRA